MEHCLPWQMCRHASLQGYGRTACRKHCLKRTANHPTDTTFFRERQFLRETQPCFGTKRNRMLHNWTEQADRPAPPCPPHATCPIRYPLAAGVPYLAGSAPALAGAIAFLTVLCYYLFGDCHRPWYKPDCSPIERTKHFFDSEQRDNVVKAVQNGEYETLMLLPSSTRADLIAIIYCDANKRIIAMQAFEDMAGSHLPITKIYFKEKN